MANRYPEKPCVDCGQPMLVVRPKQQKYCALCRLARAARIHDGRNATCPSCDQPFIDWIDPLTRRAGHNLCGRCFLQFNPQGMRESVPGACGWIEKDKCLDNTGRAMWLYSDTVRLCFICLTSPDRFTENRQAILAKYRQLTAAKNSATVE